MEKKCDVITNFGIELVVIKAGQFLMGSPATELNRDSDEGPQHKVTISRDFMMGIYPVTQDQYERVVGWNFSKFRGAERPVEMVLYEEALLFCKKLSEIDNRKYVLPTEAQWEYACRAGTDEPYCFSDSTDDIGRYAWYRDNSMNTTHPVGLKKPNAWGLYDMHGNVWEWCKDLWYEPGYEDAEQVDPLETKGYTQSLRGGAYNNMPQALRCAKRFGYQSQRFFSAGFRVIYEI